MAALFASVITASSLRVKRETATLQLNKPQPLMVAHKLTQYRQPPSILPGGHFFR